MSAPSKSEPGELRVLAATNEIAALCVEGEFDMASAPRIVEVGQRLLADEKQVILDLSEATFIDSSVIQALFRLAADARTNNRTLVLQMGTAAVVERVIEISSIDRVLPRVSTRPEAITTIRQFTDRPSDPIA